VLILRMPCCDHRLRIRSDTPILSAATTRCSYEMFLSGGCCCCWLCRAIWQHSPRHPPSVLLPYYRAWLLYRPNLSQPPCPGCLKLRPATSSTPARPTIGLNHTRPGRRVYSYTADGLKYALWPTSLCLSVAQPIHYEEKYESECEARYVFTGWSAQRDRHGAFKLKPSEARFQLLHPYRARPHSPPQTASRSNQPFCHNTHVRTDGDDECSITIPLCSAILIASDALIIISSFNCCTTFLMTLHSISSSARELFGLLYIY